MTPREKELAGQLAECREALAQTRRENDLLRQKIDRWCGGCLDRAVRSWIARNWNCSCNCQPLWPRTMPSPVKEPKASVSSFPQRARAASAGEPAGGGGSD
jgi:hypothetical protein